MVGRYSAGIIFALCLLLSIAANAANPEVRQPAWVELTPTQKLILAPVAGEWAGMSEVQRQKLIGVARQFPKMKPEQQARVQTRLIEWARLSRQEREEAREKYQKLLQLPPDKRQAILKKWKEYQRLSEEERENLRRKSSEAIAPVTVN